MKKTTFAANNQRRMEKKEKCVAQKCFHNKEVIRLKHTTKKTKQAIFVARTQKMHAKKGEMWLLKTKVKQNCVPGDTKCVSQKKQRANKIFSSDEKL